MSLYVKLRWSSGPFGQEEVWEDLVACGNRVLDSVSKEFLPHAMEVWRWSTQSELGGERLASRDVSPTFRLSAEDLPRNFTNGIVRILGLWQTRKPQEGYLNISRERMWTEVYGDLELDAYPGGGGGNLADLLIARLLPNNLVRRLFDTLSEFRGERSLVRLAYVAQRPDAEHHVQDLVSLYAHGTEDFLSLSLKTLKEEESFKNGDLAKNLRPIAEPYLLSLLRKIPLVKKRFEEVCRRTGVTVSTHSVIYLGGGEGAFGEVYGEIRSRVLMPAIQQLPPKQQLDARIRRAVVGQSTLTDSKGARRRSRG